MSLQKVTKIAMMNNLKTIIISFSISLLFSQPSISKYIEIETTSGNVIKGELIEETDEAYKILTSDGIEVNLPKKAVKKVTNYYNSNNIKDNIPIDTLLINQKKIIKNQEVMIEEVKYFDPLKNKKIGIELNPVRLLITSAEDERLTISGTVSFFSISKTAEVAFPFFYNTGEYDFQEFHIDGHYRLFLGKHRKGFYVSSGLRYTRLKGMEGLDMVDELLSDYIDDGPIITKSKLGLTFGVGYRIFGKNGWYWGTSFFGGRYLSGQEEEKTFRGSNFFRSIDSSVIYDMEILKIGRIF